MQFFSKHLTLDDQTPCILEIWDTAGQERYRALLPMYYRDADIIYLCFNLNNNTVHNVKRMIQFWMDETARYMDVNDCTMYLVGTKVDLASEEEVNMFTTGLHSAFPDLSLFITSAKDNQGIDEMFSTVVHEQMTTRQHSRLANRPGRSSSSESCDTVTNETIKALPLLRRLRRRDGFRKYAPWCSCRSHTSMSLLRLCYVFAMSLPFFILFVL